MFRVLGPLEVEVGSERRTLPGMRLRALLVALLLQPNLVVPAHRLIDVVWGDEPPHDPGNALHQVVRRLRAQLGPAGTAVRTRPPGYSLTVDPSAVDAERFEQLCREAHRVGSTDPLTAVQLLGKALELWRGPAYGEFAETFARAPAVRLEELRLGALEDRVALLLDGGAVADAIAGARELVAHHPLRPRPVEVLMRSLHADGRGAEALEAYRGHRRELAEGMGLDPPSSLQELQQRILSGEVAPRPAALPTRPVPPERTTALPWRPGPLVGREQDLALLRGCLAGERVVTLIGPGGVGKTRLALEAAHQLADAGTPVWWADLSASSAQRLFDTFADAVGVDVARGADAAASLAEALADIDGVLCLDNAETVLADLAPLVERLLAAAPRIRLVATSRERLGAAGEHVHVLAPLPVPAGAGRDNAAVRLFIERAPGLETDTVDDVDVDVIADTCRRLDGLPLAIELGAARAPTFGLRQFAAHLQEGLDLLAGGRRTAAPRHRSVRSVVDWSYGLLSEEEARLFVRLAVFPSSFAADQVEAVCGIPALRPGAVTPLLARLCEQSLVQAGDGRFWLLQTLRAYADERLAGEERRAVRERHASDTARRLTELTGLLWTDREPAAAAALGALSADLRTAWAYAVEHDRPLAVRLTGDVHDYAYYRQRPEFLEWGLTVAGWEVVHPRLPDALATAAAAAWAAGRLEEAELFTERALTAAGGPASPTAARVMDHRGTLAMFAGRTAEAVSRYRMAADLFRAAGQPVLGLVGDLSVCQVITYDDGAGEAAARAMELLEPVRRSGNPSALAWWHYVRAEAIVHTDPRAALMSYTRAIEEATHGDNRLVLMLARSSAVTLLGTADSPSVALGELGRLLDQWEDLGNTASQWWVLLSLAVELARTGQDRDAALLTGSVLAHREHQPGLVRDQRRLADALSAVRARMGEDETEALLAEGARLPFQAAVAHGRQVIRAADGSART